MTGEQKAVLSQPSLKERVSSQVRKEIIDNMAGQLYLEKDMSIGLGEWEKQFFYESNFR